MAARVSALAAILGQPTRDDDVVILSAVRTAICKAKRGAFKDLTPDVLLRHALSEALLRAGPVASRIGDVCVGNVLQPGGGAVMGRIAQLLSGMPHTVPLSAVNRQCSSGLQAVANIFAAIKAGFIDAGVGSGVESMSSNDMSESTPSVDWDAARSNESAWACTIPMGVTSENVAARYGVTRADQDRLAVRSHARAAAATKAGAFVEIVAVRVPSSEGGPDTIVTADDGIREGTTEAALARLKPAFKEGGSTTAGNSSQVSDGAAAVVLARRSVAKAAGVSPLATMLSYAVVGVPPDEMGIGPAFAIPEAVAQAGLTLDDIDVFEINEAFASQLLYSVRALGLESDLGTDRVNPLGGAIALGHPLGCTGARQVATITHFLKSRNLRYGVVSMCIGTGMGAAAVFRNDDAPSRRGGVARL